MDLFLMDGSLGLLDPAGDGAAARWIEELLEASAESRLDISLYLHIEFWAQRASDAVRLCHRIGDPRLGITFNAYHWYAAHEASAFQWNVAEEDAPVRVVDSVAQHLKAVTVCGARKPWFAAERTSVEPLDDGDLDNFVLLSQVKRIGYHGMIGLQGWGVGGDVYAKLRRSLAAFRDLEQRFESHSEWANLRFA
jgi:sugar phosphate isomerase/epimerase